MDIIKTITDWPVIAQGVLASALFWFVLELGQRATRQIAARVGKDKKTANWFSLVAHAAPPGNLQDTGRFFCLYGATHYLLKGLIVMVISFVIGGLVDVFASVGYLIALYFLFRALSFVPHSSSHGTVEERKQRFEQKLLERRKSKSAGEDIDAKTPEARNEKNVS